MKKFIDENKVLELRNQGKNCREIGVILGCGHNHINKILRTKFKLKVLNPYSHIRKYPINEDFLNDFNKEETAYFLGLLYADGCIVKDFNLIRLVLSVEDIDILNLYKEKIQPQKPLFLYKKKKESHHDHYALLINSKKLKDKLMEIGCIPNKTYHLEWPNINFTDENLKHFIRGFLDGDGCFHYNPKNKKSLCAHLCGHKLFINKIKEIIEAQLNIKCCIYKVKNTFKDFRGLYIYGGNQVEKFGDFLYNNSTIYLKRKYDKYLLIKNRPNKRINNEK